MLFDDLASGKHLLLLVTIARVVTEMSPLTLSLLVCQGDCIDQCGRQGHQE